MRQTVHLPIFSYSSCKAVDDHEVCTEDTALPQFFLLCHPTKTFLQFSWLAETRQHNDPPLCLGPWALALYMYHIIDQIVVKFEIRSNFFELYCALYGFESSGMVCWFGVKKSSLDVICHLPLKYTATHCFLWIIEPDEC